MGITLVCEERKENSESWIELVSLKLPMDERFWSPNGLSSCPPKC